LLCLKVVHILTTLLRKYTSWHWNILYTQWRDKNFEKGNQLTLCFIYNLIINITVTVESIIQRSSQGLWYAKFTQSGESRLNNFNYRLNLIQFRFLDNNPPFFAISSCCFLPVYFVCFLFEHTAFNYIYKLWTFW
jgi:hypothetical protein